jgi:hypothetical protein
MEPANVAEELERQRQRQGQPQPAPIRNNGTEATEPTNGVAEVDRGAPTSNEDLIPISRYVVHLDSSVREVPVNPNTISDPVMVPVIGEVDGQVMDLNFGIAMGPWQDPNDAGGPSRDYYLESGSSVEHRM